MTLCNPDGPSLPGMDGANEREQQSSHPMEPGLATIQLFCPLSEGQRQPKRRRPLPIAYFSPRHECRRRRGEECGELEHSVTGLIKN